MNKYNSPTSVRHLYEMKIYAELTGNCKKMRIKNRIDNNTGDVRLPRRKAQNSFFHKFARILSTTPQSITESQEKNAKRL